MKLILLIAAFAATGLAGPVLPRLINQDPNATPEEIELANEHLKTGDLTPADIRVLNGPGAFGSDDACVCSNGDPAVVGSCTQDEGCEVRQFPNGSGVGVDNLCTCLA
ncbi:hypothetical protein EDB81DRAFT_757252 [Dactylonectria macrodidyma]|uniref:Uncharacterized protein n=1 Tax=Dactylonectria macrodidyma TaxID=307937 RepID=A0A9P9FB89_9HYPO|nr:hypothetical protein EDB81DRAFT_757252 [Dactylonectria macrodidyma]